MVSFTLFLVIASNTKSNLSNNACCFNKNNDTHAHWNSAVRIYEYVSNANPIMSEVPIRIFAPVF